VRCADTRWSLEYAWVIGTQTVFVAGDHGARAQRSDLVDGAYPGVESTVGAFGEILVHAVVGDVAGVHVVVVTAGGGAKVELRGLEPLALPAKTQREQR
jgi:hypothetical protein